MQSMQQLNWGVRLCVSVKQAPACFCPLKHSSQPCPENQAGDAGMACSQTRDRPERYVEQQESLMHNDVRNYVKDTGGPN